MIDSVEITNFRGFGSFRADDLSRINLIVGDNGVGKTALLEAVFLTLCGNADKALALKRWRGLDVSIQVGSADSVADGIYSDLFHDSTSSQPILIKLHGSGFANRQLEITRKLGDVIIPTEPASPKGNRQQRRAQKQASRQTLATGETKVVPIELKWVNEKGASYVSRALLSASGLRFEGTGEKIPISYMFASQASVSIEEPAGILSQLRVERREGVFKKTFLDVFDWIKDISVETIGNAPTILADVPWAPRLMPLPAISGGTTRAAAILLALTHRRDGVVLVDEIENGVFHARQKRFAKALLEVARSCESQIIMTSHSEEWIQHFLSATSEQTDDVACWRLERVGQDQPRIRRFSVPEFRVGMAAGEMR